MSHDTGTMEKNKHEGNAEILGFVGIPTYCTYEMNAFLEPSEDIPDRQKASSAVVKNPSET